MFKSMLNSINLGIMNIAIESLVPCMNAIMTFNNQKELVDCSSKIVNEGSTFGKAAIEMAFARLSAFGISSSSSRNDSNADDRSINFVHFNSSVNQNIKENKAGEFKKKISF